jgi:CheY-like chemotaxis protein
VPADPEYAGRLRAAQIAAIVRLTPLTMGASCLNAAILLLTLGRMGSLRPGLWIWSVPVFALAAYYGRNWWAGRHRDPNRPATSRAVRRAIVHGWLFGGLWGLEEAGFATEGPKDASRALAYLDQGKAVDALITDFAMPGMNGLDLIREVQRRNPTLPMILLTGYVGDIAARSIEHEVGGRVIVLQKPVRPVELAERLSVAVRVQGDGGRS